METFVFPPVFALGGLCGDCYEDKEPFSLGVFIGTVLLIVIGYQLVSIPRKRREKIEREEELNEERTWEREEGRGRKEEGAGQPRSNK